MTMADCRHCRTRITTTRDTWIHLDPGSPCLHAPEPPLDHAWHKRDTDRDVYGPRWPRADAEIQLPVDFYDRGPAA